MASVPQHQVPGLYHRRIGDIMVTAVSDGYLDTPVAALDGITAEDAGAILTRNFQPTPPRVSINCFLVWSGGRVALVDTGAGDTMGPTLGHLPRTLAALGLTREDIDTILLTHMHPDHSNGLTAADGSAHFPHAEIVVSETDMRHWHDDSERAKVAEDKQRRYFDGARFQPALFTGTAPRHVGSHLSSFFSCFGHSFLRAGGVLPA
ncbi:MBL fold metallo-hydrolase [Citreimonas sp.]|uniref:MBL fold metallo-hydrolase n=1 Tax=Citreimonas sp. TaxID=3036715 RepID=UPI0040596E73